MIGTKVKLTKSYAKWYLEHPEIFESPRDGSVDADFDVTMQHCILTLLGADVVGIVTHKGNDGCWRVEFSTPFGKKSAYYEFRTGINKVK